MLPSAVLLKLRFYRKRQHLRFDLKLLGLNSSVFPPAAVSRRMQVSLPDECL